MFLLVTLGKSRPARGASPRRSVSTCQGHQNLRPDGTTQHQTILFSAEVELRVASIPEDNLFVGVPGVDEIYAYGLRNPYRFSFDDGRGGDGTLFLADVGHNLFEEINIIEKGGNYGWVTAEGFFCFDPFGPVAPPANCPGVGPNGEPLLNPIASYHHQDGIAVVGGFVYRGSTIPELVGKYVFGDFSRSFLPGNGRLFWLDAEGALSQIFEFNYGPGTSDPLNLYVFGFAADEGGELYVLTSENLGPTGTGGKVFRIAGP